jgi:predicted Zn-dependent protease with MMP-like domain
MRLRRHEFEALIAEALDGLPPYFQEAMNNVAVLVESWPSRRQLRETQTPRGHTLLGLYEGIPLTERYEYSLVPPDTITLFQGPLEESCETPEEIREAVRHTVIHEIAHHFGIDDDRLRELGAY